MIDMHDDELRARFAGLRASDELSAPEFVDVLDRARHSAHSRVSARRWLSPLAISIAAAAVVIAAVGIARASRRAAFVAPPLSTWTSPTAGLLRTPGTGQRQPATLISSLVDIATTPATPQTGKHK